MAVSSQQAHGRKEPEMERRNVSIATVGLTLLLMSCTGGVRACGTTDQGTPASATVTAGVTSSGAGKLGESPKSAQTPAATQPSSTTAPPAAPPPGLGTLGDLPKIAPTPAGTTDVAAAALARQVLAGDAGSLPALLRAIDLAGFTIQHAGVTVQAPSAASQGIVFQAWEVQALNKLMRDKLVTSFGQAAALFATMTKETATVPFETLMYEGLRANAAAKNQALRFWARFIAELGFQGPGAYDLLSNDPPHQREHGRGPDRVHLQASRRRPGRVRQGFCAEARESTRGPTCGLDGRYGIPGVRQPSFARATDQPQRSVRALG